MRVIIEKVPQRTDINSTIKPIDREDANAEIELGEIVFDPKKLTLHQALGKKHYQKGTPVNLNEGAFILSDFNKLAFSKKELESFELKSGGKYSKKKSTPAKILEKNVDLRHHNKLVEILSRDPRLINDATLNSAQLMVEKNLEKVGLVSFLQENKKNFTDGPPQFSMGTAPVYSDDMDKRLKQVDQYLKGGKFLRKFQNGKNWFSDKYGRRVVPENGSFYTTPPKGYNEDEYISDLMRYINETTGSSWDPSRKGLIDMRSYQGNTFGDIVSDAGANQYWNKNKTTDKEYVDSKRPYYDAFGIIENPLQFAEQQEADIWMQENKARTFTDANNMTWASWRDPNTNLGFYRKLNITPTVAEKAPETPSPSATSVNGNDPGDPKYSLQRTDYNMPFTDWQKMNMAYPFLKAATVKTYLPIRQHQESLIARPELISVQPQLNANNQAAFNASQLARVVSPAQSSSVIGNVLGQRLDANNQVLGNVANANNQITNTWRAQTAQTLNSDAAANRGFDKLYTDQVNTALQNRDDMKDYLVNQGITNVNSNIAQRESFNQWMNSQDQIQTDEIVGYNPDKTPIFRTRAITEFSPTFAGFRAKSPVFNFKALQTYNTGLTNQQQDQFMNQIYQNALATIENPNASDALKSAAFRFLNGRHLVNYNRNRQ